MPLPAVVSLLPALASGAVALFTSFTSVLLSFSLFKFSVFAVSVGLYILVVTAFILAIQSLISGLIQPVVPAPFLQGLSYFLPSNAVECVSVVLTGKVAQRLLNEKQRLIELFNEAK